MKSFMEQIQTTIYELGSQVSRLDQGIDTRFTSIHEHFAEAAYKLETEVHKKLSTFPGDPPYQGSYIPRAPAQGTPHSIWNGRNIHQSEPEEVTGIGLGDDQDFHNHFRRRDGQNPSVDESVRTYNFLSDRYKQEEDIFNTNAFVVSYSMDESKHSFPYAGRKSLASPSQILSALRNTLKITHVSLSNVSFAPWKKWIDSVLKAVYLSSLTMIPFHLAPTTAEEWKAIDFAPQTVGAFHYFVEKLTNSVVPECKRDDNIYTLTGAFLAVMKVFPELIGILQPMVLQSITGPLRFAISREEFTGTNLRLIYFEVVKRFKSSTDDAIARRLQKFLLLQYDPVIGPSAFVTKLKKAQYEINSLTTIPQVSESLLRTTFIKSIKSTTKMFNHLFDSLLLGQKRSLDEIVTILDAKFQDERLSSSLDKANLSTDTDFQPEHVEVFAAEEKSERELICYQWGDRGTCSYGEKCKYKSYHKEENKFARRGKANLAGDGLREQFHQLVEEAKAVKQAVRKLKSSNRKAKEKANILKRKFIKAKSMIPKSNVAHDALIGDVDIDEAADAGEASTKQLQKANNIDVSLSDVSSASDTLSDEQ